MRKLAQRFAVLAAVAVPTVALSAVIFTARVDSPANPMGAGIGNFNRLAFIRTTAAADRYQLVVRHFPILTSGQLGTEVNPNEQYTNTPGAAGNTNNGLWGADHNEWVGAVLRDDLAGRAVDVSWSVTANL